MVNNYIKAAGIGCIEKYLNIFNSLVDKRLIFLNFIFLLWAIY